MPKHRNTWETIGTALAVILGFMIVWASVAGAGPSGRVTLTAAEKIEADADPILLGQIVTIESAADDVKARLEKIKIGRAAQAGRTRSISRDYILLRLRQSGFDPAGFDIRIPPKVSVRRSAVKVSREEMEMMVRDHLLALPTTGQAQVNITAVRIKGDVLLPKGAIQHEVQPQFQSAPSRMLPVAIVFKVDGRYVRKVSALVSLEIMQNVVVSRRPIPRLKIISADDVMLRQVNTAGLPDSFYRATADVIGKRARRAIGMNAELHANMVETPPVVAKGDRVLIVAESGNLRITAMGEVKHTGKVGEQVRVVNLDSKKTVMAQVVDHRTVRVAF